MGQIFIRAVLLILFLIPCLSFTTTRSVALENNKQSVITGQKRGTVFLSLNGHLQGENQEPRRSRFLPRTSPFRSKSNKRIDIPPKIEIVNMTNAKGISYGQYILPVYSGDILLDVLEKELSAVGYSVQVVRKLPWKATMGIDISWVNADLAATDGLFSRGGSCDLAVTIDTWRNGIKAGSRDYEAKVLGQSFTEYHLLFTSLIRQATNHIVATAIPDIIRDFSAGQK